MGSGPIPSSNQHSRHSPARQYWVKMNGAAWPQRGTGLEGRWRGLRDALSQREREGVMEDGRCVRLQTHAIGLPRFHPHTYLYSSGLTQRRKGAKTQRRMEMEVVI